MLAALLTLLATTHAAPDTWTAGSTVDNAGVAHLTEGGLDAVGELVPILVPAEPMPIDDVVQGGGYGCGDGSDAFEFALRDAWVGFAVDDATLVPSAGQLDMVIDAQVWLNDSGDPFTISYQLFCGGEDCPGYVTPFPVTIEVPATLRVVEVAGENWFDVTLGEVGLVNGLASKHIQLDCIIGTIFTIDSVLDSLGLTSLVDLIKTVADPIIVAVINDQKGDIEEAIEDALNAARVDQEVDIAGVLLDVKLEPHEVWIKADGLELVYEGHAHADPSGCVDEWDPGWSEGTVSDPPPISDDPLDVHAGLLVSDDLANQALYSLWRGGLLCQELTSDMEGLPIPIDTSLLGLLAGDAFDEIFPEPQPMLVRTEPHAAPVVDYAAGHDVTVVARELGVNFFAVVDHRMAHPLGLDVSADVGLDLVFDGSTGELELVLGLGEDDVWAEAASNELVRDAEDEILANFAGVVVNLLDVALGILAGDLSFQIPSMEGVGLTSLDVEPAGAAEDWMGAWAQVGPVSYGGDVEGCEGSSCSSTATGAGWAALYLAVLVGLRRRRR